MQITEATNFCIVRNYRLNPGKLDQANIHETRLETDDLAGRVPLKKITGSFARKVRTVIARHHEIFDFKTLDRIGDFNVEIVDRHRETVKEARPYDETICDRLGNLTFKTRISRQGTALRSIHDERLKRLDDAIGSAVGRPGSRDIALVDETFVTRIVREIGNR